MHSSISPVMHSCFCSVMHPSTNPLICTFLVHHPEHPPSLCPPPPPTPQDLFNQHQTQHQHHLGGIHAYRVEG